MYLASATRSEAIPELLVYCVSPRLSDSIPASRIRFGVTKSGSPIPNEITSDMVAAMSKKRRMPDGGIDSTRCETKLRVIVFSVITHFLLPTNRRRSPCDSALRRENCAPGGFDRVRCRCRLRLHQ